MICHLFHLSEVEVTGGAVAMESGQVLVSGLLPVVQTQRTVVPVQGLSVLLLLTVIIIHHDNHQANANL